MHKDGTVKQKRSKEWLNSMKCVELISIIYCPLQTEEVHFTAFMGAVILVPHQSL